MKPLGKVSKYELALLMIQIVVELYSKIHILLIFMETFFKEIEWEPVS